jgi:hypothetical protein
MPLPLCGTLGNVRLEFRAIHVILIIVHAGLVEHNGWPWKRRTWEGASVRAARRGHQHCRNRTAGIPFTYRSTLFALLTASSPIYSSVPDNSGP